MKEGPFHCGPRMTIIPGYAVRRFKCDNCGAVAVTTKNGFKIYPIDKLHLIGKESNNPLLTFFQKFDKPPKEDR